MKPESFSNKPPRARLKAAAIMAGILAVGLTGAFVASGTQENAPAQPKKMLQFSTQEVTQPHIGPVTRVVEFSGPLLAPTTAVVKAGAAATLLELHVNEGSRVKAGQVLGHLDLSGLRTQVADRSASVALARATLDEVESHHKANESLAERRFISSAALRTSLGRLDVSRAQLDSAKAQLASARVTEREAALLAPIDGIIARRHTIPGERLAVNQTVFTIVDLRSLELAGTVAMHEAPLLQVGQNVTIDVAGDAAPLQARVQRIAPQAEPGSSAIGVVVVIDNAAERYRAGQYALARLEIADPAPKMTLPATAVGQSSGQSYVWVIEQGRLLRRLIVTGRSDARTGRVVVEQGLAPRAQVLAVRFDNLKEGTAAKVAGKAATVAVHP